MTEKKLKVTKKIPAAKVKKPRARGKFYINRAELLADVIASKEQGKMTDGLSTKLVLLTSKYATKGQFASYTYNDDMQGYANMMLVHTWHSFNPEKSDNPFAFYTQCVKNSFRQFLNKEKKQRNIRDAILVDNGLSPSYTYLTEYQEQSEQEQQESSTHDEEDFGVMLQEDTKLNVTSPNIFGDNLEPNN